MSDFDWEDVDVGNSDSGLVDDFDVDLDPTHDESIQSGIFNDKMVKTYSPDTNELYQGKWVRKLFEEQRNKYQITPYDEDWYDKFSESLVHLGYTEDPNNNELISVPVDLEQFNQHGGIFGQTGVGKSVTMKNLALQFINMGYGCMMVSPKDRGDLVDLVRAIPPERRDDIVMVSYDSESEYVPCLNYLDSHYSQSSSNIGDEAEEIRDTARSIIYSHDPQTGNIIEGAIDGYVTPMAISDVDFSPIDIYEILRNKEYRQKWADWVEDNIGEISDEFNYETIANDFAEYDNDKTDAAKRRFKVWNSGNHYNAIKNRKTTLDFDEILDENKIVLVDLENKPDNFVSTVSILLIRQLWNAANRRDADADDDERLQPFYAIIDEFDSIVNSENYESMDIENIFSEARSKGFHLVPATQFPSQLPDEVQSQMSGNVKNLISMRVEENSDANMLAQQYGSDNIPVRADDIIGLSDYTAYIQREKEDPIIINTFPDFPPRISMSEANQLLEQSQRKYGYSKSQETQRSIIYDVLDGASPSKDDDDEEGDLIPTLVMIGQYYEAAQEGNYDYDISENRWISKDTFEKIVDAVDEVEIDDITYYLESEASGLRVTNDHDGVKIKLDTEGENSGYEQAKRQDSGKSGSAGKADHRLGLINIQREFARLGAAVLIPTQGGEELADGIAYKFGNDNTDALEKIFNGKEKAHVENEKSTLNSKKGQTVKNLGKAARNGVNTVFVVSDGEEDFTEFAKKAESLANGGVRGDRETGTFLLNLENDLCKEEVTGYKYPVRKRNGSKKDTMWFERDGEYILKDSEGRTVTTLDLEQLKNDSWSVDDFEYYAKKSEDGKWVVWESDTAKAVERYDSKSEMKEEYMTVKKPSAPKTMMPGERRPTADDFSVIIVPKGGGEPVAYDVETQLQTPLYETSDETEQEDEGDDNDNDDEWEELDF